MAGAPSGARRRCASTEAQLQQAVQAFKRAVELDPLLVSAQIFLTTTLALNGKVDEAIERLDLIERLSPNDPRIARILQTEALVHFAANNYEKAVSCAKELFGTLARVRI